MRIVTYAAFSPPAKATGYVERAGYAVWFLDANRAWVRAQAGQPVGLAGTFAMVATEKGAFPPGTTVLADVTVEGSIKDPFPPPPALVGDGGLDAYPRGEAFVRYVRTHVQRGFSDRAKR